MALTIDPGLLDYLKAPSGARYLQLTGAEDPEAARSGLEQVRRALYTIPHPDEPTDPLPSFSSEVSDAGSGPQFWFDAADAEAYEGLLERVIEVAVQTLRDAGVENGLLTWPHPGDKVVSADRG